MVGDIVIEQEHPRVHAHGVLGKADATALVWGRAMYGPRSKSSSRKHRATCVGASTRNRRCA